MKNSIGMAAASGVLRDLIRKEFLNSSVLHTSPFSFSLRSHETQTGLKFTVKSTKVALNSIFLPLPPKCCVSWPTTWFYLNRDLNECTAWEASAYDFFLHSRESPDSQKCLRCICQEVPQLYLKTLLSSQLRSQPETVIISGKTFPGSLAWFLYCWRYRLDVTLREETFSFKRDSGCAAKIRAHSEVKLVLRVYVIVYHSER